MSRIILNIKNLASSTAAGILFVCLAAALLILSLVPAAHVPFISPEAKFTDASAHGLAIMPASCASYGDSAYDYAIGTVGDGGLFVPPSGYDYGGYIPSAGMVVCVENRTGSPVYIGARTGGELQSMKNLGTSRGNLLVW